MNAHPTHRPDSGKPRVLFLCQTLPFPPDNGVNVRAYNTLKLLAGQFELTSLFFYRRANRPEERDVRQALAGIQPLTEAAAFPIPQEHSRLRFLGDHAESVFTRRPYTYYLYRSAAFSERLDALLKSRRFDLVHVDSLDLSRYLPLLSGIPVACTHHNVESDLLRQRSAATRGWPRRRYMLLQAGLTEREERHWCPAVDINVAVSDADRTRLRELAPSARFIVVPNGVDTEYFTPRPGGGGGVVFVGGYDWFPNRDAMSYFAETILEPFRKRCPDVPLTWVGRVPPDAAKHFQSEHGIQIAGFVQDLRPTVAAADCYIAPLRVGGGTRLKLVEGMAMGKAIVSSSQGCEGLDARDGDNMLVRDEPVAFAEAMEAVIRNLELRERLGAQARATAVKRYSWTVVGKTLLDAYRQIIAAPVSFGPSRNAESTNNKERERPERPRHSPEER